MRITDQFSKSLAETIPRKVHYWLLQLKRRPRGTIVLDNVAYTFGRTAGGTITVMGEGENISLKWTGKAMNPKNVDIDCDWANRIVHELSKFVALEKAIYDPLEKLQRKMVEEEESARRDFSAFAAAQSQSESVRADAS